MPRLSTNAAVKFFTTYAQVGSLLADASDETNAALASLVARASGQHPELARSQVIFFDCVCRRAEVEVNAYLVAHDTEEKREAAAAAFGSRAKAYAHVEAPIGDVAGEAARRAAKELKRAAKSAKHA